MGRFIEFIVAAALLMCLGVGCGPAPEKGINKGKDKPVPADPEGKPKAPEK